MEKYNYQKNLFFSKLVSRVVETVHRKFREFIGIFNELSCLLTTPEQ